MKKSHIVTAGMLMYGISVSAYSPWADMQKHFEEMEQTFAQMRKEMHIIASEAQGDSKRSPTQRYLLNTETLQRDGASLFVVKATLPDMKQEDIKIAVTVDIDENGKQAKKLEISSAHKEEEIKTVKKSKKNSTVAHSYSSLMQSSSWSNGLGRTVRFDNGVLKMTADLPSSVDEENYVMKFDDATKQLVIEFVQTVTTPTKKIELKFESRG